MRLDDALRVFATWAPDLRESTRRRVRYEIDRFCRVLGDVPFIESIRTASFVEFRSRSVSAGLRPRSIESTVGTVRTVLAACEEVGLLSAVPGCGRRLRMQRPAPSPVTASEFDAIYAETAVADWPSGLTPADRVQWWHSWLVLAWWTGLRVTDLTWGITWGDVSLTSRVIRHTASKTGAAHVFPMVPCVVWHLLRLQSVTGPRVALGDRVFGVGRSPHILRRELSRICEAAGVRPITPKQFRQAAVTAWSVADSTAGRIVHGCGLPEVMAHYLDPLAILTAAAPRVVLPSAAIAASNAERCD